MPRKYIPKIVPTFPVDPRTGRVLIAVAADTKHLDIGINAIFKLDQEEVLQPFPVYPHPIHWLIDCYEITLETGYGLQTIARGCGIHKMKDTFALQFHFRTLNDEHFKESDLQMWIHFEIGMPGGAKLGSKQSPEATAKRAEKLKAWQAEKRKILNANAGLILDSDTN
jgi:hypothetical protein